LSILVSHCGIGALAMMSFPTFCFYFALMDGNGLQAGWRKTEAGSLRLRSGQAFAPLTPRTIHRSRGPRRAALGMTGHSMFVVSHSCAMSPRMNGASGDPQSGWAKNKGFRDQNLESPDLPLQTLPAAMLC
jgi:hypothetical protein